MLTDIEKAVALCNYREQIEDRAKSIMKEAEY